MIWLNIFLRILLLSFSEFKVFTCIAYCEWGKNLSYFASEENRRGVFSRLYGSCPQTFWNGSSRSVVEYGIIESTWQLYKIISTSFCINGTIWIQTRFWKTWSFLNFPLIKEVFMLCCLYFSSKHFSNAIFTF